MPETALRSIGSWHRYMPDWKYVLWNEDNFDVSLYTYTQEAYDARKYAFVSDVVRLYALKEYGGIYLDVDFEVYKSFDELLSNAAFAGFEGSKHNPVMMGVLGSVAKGEWVSRQLSRYENRRFIVSHCRGVLRKRQTPGSVPGATETGPPPEKARPSEWTETSSFCKTACGTAESPAR